MKISLGLASLSVFVVSVVILSQTATATDEFENYVRRNIPTGFTMSAFVEICEACGVLYGKDFTYKCLADKTMKTFKGCFIAVNEKR